MRHDEHGWEPYGPAHTFDLQAGLNEQGAIVAWKIEGWPTLNSSSSGSLYEFENLLAVNHAFDTYFLTSPLRAPQQPATTFAVESFIDEIAAAEGVDPIEFRLRHLTDPREIEVLQAVAARAGWETRPSPKPGNSRTGVATGRGIAYAPRGGNPETLVAQIAEVEVDQATGSVRVKRFVVAHDCGLIINPDSVIQQIEGQVIQTTSRTLLEEVMFDNQRVTSLDWITYPYLKITDVPEVDVVLINRPELPTGQVGEPATASVPAAIANAIFDATGTRLHRVPFTPERMKAALDARA
jgi:CO/xanthine dehydrogenase Mo-binding subunit